MGFSINDFVGNVTRGVARNVTAGRSITTSILSGALASGVSGGARRVLSAFLGGMTIPDVYITDLDHGNSLALSWIPEKISLKAGTKMQSYSVIERGDIKFPKGEELTSISWKAKLPGDKNTGASYIKSMYWHRPNDILKVFKNWREKGSKLHLLVTQTAINLDVYLDDYDADYAGSQGDIDYSISFIAAKDMMIKTVEEADLEAQEAMEEADVPILQSRPALSQAEQICITGAMLLDDTNNAWTIGQMAFGDGSTWPQIASANNGVSEKIPAGTMMKIPGVVMS